MEYGGLSQEEEVDLAAELLTITNEDELDQFLGKFFRRVGRGVRGVMRNPVFRQLGGMVKGSPSRRCPWPAPPSARSCRAVGTAIGGSLGTAASRLFEVDVEAMSDEDAQFEVARRWVRLAGDAAQQARRVADATDPRQAARQALAAAARRHAPGLARALGSGPRAWGGEDFTARDRPGAGSGAADTSSCSGPEVMALIAHHRFLAQEARALLTRLGRVRPFVLHETMVPAAALPLAAQAAIERHLLLARRELGARVRAFLAWLESPAGQAATPEEAQRRFTFLRLRFNALLAQVDIFADVLTQRSEHETGVWLAGLDALAADALRLPGGYYDAAAGRLLPRPRPRRRDPPRPHPPAGRRREPGRGDPRPARADGRQRHRLLAGPRGRAPGGVPARPHRLAANGAGRAAGGRARPRRSPGACCRAG